VGIVKANCSEQIKCGVCSECKGAKNKIRDAVHKYSGSAEN